MLEYLRGDNMELYDTFKYLVGGYYGIENMDEYPLKEYILKDIENYILNFIEVNNMDIDYLEEKEKINYELSLKTKLQDSLLVLPKIDAPMELVLLVKKRIKNLKEEEK